MTHEPGYHYDHTDVTARIHVDRDAWRLQIVREPRPSCLPAWRLRETLRQMLPGESAMVGNRQVHRVTHRYQTACYVIDGGDTRLTFAAAVRALESEAA